MNELEPLFFTNINEAYNFGRVAMTETELGENESLFIEIYPEIDDDGNEYWKAIRFIKQYYPTHVLLRLLSNEDFYNTTE